MNKTKTFALLFLLSCFNLNYFLLEIFHVEQVLLVRFLSVESTAKSSAVLLSRHTDHVITNVLSVHSYRKIPGDKCEGGEMRNRKEIDLSKRCVSDLVNQEILVSIAAY